MALNLFTRLFRLPATARPNFSVLSTSLRTPIASSPRAFSTSSPFSATYNQVMRGCRVAQRARKPTSPQLKDRPEMKGVCVRVGITKPKKPNSGERKVAREEEDWSIEGNPIALMEHEDGSKAVWLTRVITGHNVQQHSVVLVRGGRSQDCPGVKYHLVRGALDLGGVGNRITSRSKYGTKKPKAA
ncbi:ribosomal protein S12 [Aureobasidium pullulans]|uniref:Ribosomal protein S12 n=1 Tax=Aureobasidium pullulans TaxID=5580 RepID=A0A4S8VDB1_AURPU|nr:ribosomal protein S12 [Aureobasidium pullulans]